MKLLRTFWARLRATLIGEWQDRERALGLDAHLQMLTDDNMRAGISPEEAHRRTRIAPGGLGSFKDRDRREFPQLSSLWRELSYAARALRRDGTFTATAVLMRGRALVPRPPFSAWPRGNVELFSYSFSREFRRKNRVFSNVAAICSQSFATHVRMTHSADLEKLNVELVSGSYFDMLGFNPIPGRALPDADDRTPGARPVAVATSPGLRIPLAMQKESSSARNGIEKNLFQSLHIIACLKPNVSEKQAEAETNLIFRRIEQSYAAAESSRQDPENIQYARIDQAPGAAGRSCLRTQFSSPLEILMARVALVLLIACANVANLLLGGATARRQLQVESGLLAFAGAALGLLLAWGASHLLLLMVSTGADFVPIRVTPDAAALAFAVGMAIVTVILFGLAPAFHITGLDLASALKESRAIASTGSLFVCAGLFLPSLTNLMDVDTGFDRHDVVPAGVDVSGPAYQNDARRESLAARLEQRVGSLPGMQGARFAYSVFSGRWTTDIAVPGRSTAEKDPAIANNIVGPRYIDVMRIRIVLGRTFGLRDEVARDPEWQNIEVVGAVRDGKYMSLQEKPMPAAFYPHARHTGRYLGGLVVRYPGSTTAAVSAIRGAVREIDPSLPLSDVTTLAQTVDDSVLNKRVAAQLSTFFGLLAASLACIGIYGVMSWSIARRTGEFGIWTVLSAGKPRVLWIVLREILWLVAAGLATGLALALVSSRLIGSLLYGYFRARRAIRIDPMEALRYE